MNWANSFRQRFPSPPVSPLTIAIGLFDCCFCCCYETNGRARARIITHRGNFTRLRIHRAMHIVVYSMLFDSFMPWLAAMQTARHNFQAEKEQNIKTTQTLTINLNVCISVCLFCFDFPSKWMVFVVVLFFLPKKISINSSSNNILCHMETSSA